MKKNFTIKTGQTQVWSLTFRKTTTFLALFFLTLNLVQANAFLDVTVTSTAVSCDIGNDGTATALPINGWAPFTYEWSNGETTQTIDGLAPGTYSVTVIDVDGAIAIGSTEVGGCCDLDLFLSASYETCPGSADGTASVNVSGGVEPSTYLWSTGETFVVASGLSAGDYTVTVTDATGCSAVGMVTVELSPEGVWLMPTATNTDCGLATGTAYAGVMTGVPPYMFLWSDGQTTETATGLAAGNYTVTVTDSNGCTNSESVTVESNSDLDITLSGTDAECGVANGSATVTVNGGTAPFTYEWSTGETTQSIDNLTAGTYSVTVTDIDGCSNAGTITIEAQDGIELIVTGTDANCNSDDGTATAEVSGGNPPYTYSWSTGAATATISGLTPGTYSVTVADDNGCGATGSVTIGGTTVDGGFIITTDATQICVGDGSDDLIDVSLSGNIGSNSQWLITTPGLDILGLFDSPPFNFENAPPGVCVIWHLSYDGIITGLEVGLNAGNLSGCFDLSNSIEVLRQNCCDLDGGDLSTNSNTTVCVGDGIDDFINVSLSGASAGVNQNWVITDQDGNILGLPTAPPFNFEGAGSGVCLIWSISYEDGLTGLTVGANVADLDGCFALSNQSIAVTRNLAPTVILSGTDVSCNGGSDGSISTSVSDGTAPFTYSWSNGETGSSIDGLSTGTYSVTVTDANGCSDEAAITVSEPAAISLAFDGGDETCIDSADGFATVTVSGGTAPYNYLWSNGATTATINGLTAGTYGVTVTDANGCVAENANAVIIISNGITSCSAEVTSSYNEGVDISTFGGNDGSAAVNVFGGTAPLSYLWSDGQTGASATGLSAGTYTVDITDANGCTCSAEVTLVDPSKIGDFVWEDDNRNGIQDAGEPGIGGITVMLTGTTADGTSVNRMTSTDNNGAYSFDGLSPGNYKVTFDAGSYKTSPQGAGSDESLDSDINEDTGMTDYFDLGLAECNNDIDAGFYECVSIGDFVFYDGNRDGIQQPWEAGVADVFVRLHSTGPDGIYCNEDDEILDGAVTGNDGRYLFECLEPGEYYVSFGANTNEYSFSNKDQGGDDELDSDADPMTTKTDPFNIVEGQADDLSYDAGIYLICDDFSYGGQIGYNQEICFGEAADPLVSINLPTGGYGDTEYLWLKSNTGGPLTNGSWVEVQNNDSPTYDPGFLNSTTFFIRCARRENCDNFVAESNVVTITVLNCGPNGFIQNLSADLMASSRIALHWSTEPENGLYRYHIERSVDAIDFDAVGIVEGLGNQQSMNRYVFMDNTPRLGRNMYRVIRENLSTGEIMYSNTVEAMFNPSEERFFVYPNPTRNELFVESIYNMNGNATLELYSATGQLLEVVQVDEQSGKTSIDFRGYASGPYFIKVLYQDKDGSEVIRIIKE